MIDEDTKNIFLQNLDEYVLDEEKIVTARWLARTLNISYKDSTNVLSIWVDLKKNKEILLTTYAVSGKKKDGSIIVTVLRDHAVEDFVRDLNDVSKSIYSTQKGVLKDIQLLAAVNECFSSCLGGVKGPPCEKRIPPSLIQEAPVIKPECKTTKIEKANGNASTNSIKKEPESNSSQKPTKGKEIAKGGIVNFFNKQGSKNSNNLPKKSDFISTTSKPKSMQDFFKKTSPPKNSVQTEEITSNDDTSIDAVIKGSTTKISPINACPQQVTNSEKILVKKENVSSDGEIPGTPEVIVEKYMQKNKTKSKRIRENSDEGNTKKRRKRIVVQSDSSDDDIFGRDTDEEMEKMEDIQAKSTYSEPGEETIIKMSPELNYIKSKRKKMVNKTYTDEDGFIITRRELVECSESEDDISEVKEKFVPPPKSPKRPSVNPGTKQSNLMNFFKKK